MSARQVAVFGSVLAGLLLTVVGVQAIDDSDEAEERDISLQEAPEAIRNALKGIEVEEIEVETENGQAVYDVVLELDDTELELELTADAQLIGVEIERDEDEVEEGDDD